MFRHLHICSVTYSSCLQKRTNLPTWLVAQSTQVITSPWNQAVLIWTEIPHVCGFIDLVKSAVALEYRSDKTPWVSHNSSWGEHERQWEISQQSMLSKCLNERLLVAVRWSPYKSRHILCHCIFAIDQHKREISELPLQRILLRAGYTSSSPPVLWLLWVCVNSEHHKYTLCVLTCPDLSDQRWGCDQANNVNHLKGWKTPGPSLFACVQTLQGEEFVFQKRNGQGRHDDFAGECSL